MSGLSFRRENSYIVVWPGDDECAFRVGGEDVVVPSVNEVADGSRYRYPAAKLNGRPVPGTVVLRDVYRNTPNGAKKEFDAKECLEILHDINEPLIKRGLRVVDRPEDIETARAEGRPGWDEAQEAADREEIRLEFERQEKWKQKYPGVPVARASNEEAVKAAIERNKKRLLTNRAAFTQADLVSALGGTPTTTVNAAVASVREEGPSITQIAEHLYEMSEKHSVTLTKDQLKGLLRKEPKAMEEVRATLEAKGVALAL